MDSAERRLRELERSEIFAPDFPKRLHLTHAQWSSLSEDERTEARLPEIVAIRRAKDRGLVELIERIGDAAQESAVPLLARLWSDCALVPVRTAVGLALRAIGTRNARAALQSQIEDADHFSVFLAIRAVFDDDPSTAFDRLAPYFEKHRVTQPGGSVIPEEVLRTFGPAPRPEQKAGESYWTMREPNWFGGDERWMDLCVRLRRDEHLGRVARAVLTLADVDRVRTALSLARTEEGPSLVRVAVHRFGRSSSPLSSRRPRSGLG